MPIFIEQPVAYYGALTAAMSGFLYLFVSTAQSMAALQRRVEREVSDRDAAMATVESRLGEWAGRTADLESTVAGLSATRRAKLPITGIDANQRMQVLRLARRGDRPEKIAADLGVPRSEVDLLLKVQRAVVRVF